MAIRNCLIHSGNSWHPPLYVCFNNSNHENVAIGGKQCDIDWANKNTFSFKSIKNVDNLLSLSFSHLYCLSKCVSNTKNNIDVTINFQGIFETVHLSKVALGISEKSCKRDVSKNHVVSGTEVSWHALGRNSASNEQRVSSACFGLHRSRHSHLSQRKLRAERY